MGGEAWGTWGDEDERGALNYIGVAEVKGAAALVCEGRVISLAQPMSTRTPVPQQRTPLLHFMSRDGGDYAAGGRRPGGFQFSEDTVVLPLHFGTHVDALCHAWYDDALYNGFSSTGIRSTTGASRCGIEKMGAIVGRGVLLDVAADTGRALGMGEAITRDMLANAISRARVRIEKGDVVLIRTGWAEARLASPEYYDGEPGLDVRAARWLAECGVAAVGSDNFAIEQIPFPGEQVFPVHQCLIRDFGVALVEGLQLSALSQAEAITFLFVAAPLPICGGTGSPLAPIAVL